jgi:hypothetical protein
MINQDLKGRFINTPSASVAVVMHEYGKKHPKRPGALVQNLD